MSASEIVVGNLSSVWSSVSDQSGPEPGEESSDWIVRLTAAATADVGSLGDISQLLSNSNFDIQAAKGLSTPGLVEVRSKAASAIDVEQYLETHISVASFELDGEVTAQLSANDEFYASNSLVGLRNLGADGAVNDADIDADLAWDITIGSTTVVTTIIDSGVDYRHPDLYLNIWLNNGEIPTSLQDQLVDVDSDGLITFRDLNQPENAAFVTELTGDGNDYIDAGDLLADPIWANSVDEDGNGRIDDIIGWDFRDNDNDPMDTHGHGTHIAGTIGAIGNNGLGVTGVTWVGSIMPLRFLDRVPGQGLTGSRSDAISAIEYTTDLASNRGVNVQVSNNSWGSLDAFSSELRTTIEANGDAGVLFVAAAGNGEGRTGRGIDLDTENIGFYPATYDLDTIVAVAASDPRDNLAIFSQFGATSIDLAAPGVGILSTDLNGTYSTRNGTSMATPHVAGVAALIFAQQTDATPEEVRRALLEGVDAKSALADRVATGGRLNAQQALQADTFAPKAFLVSAPDVLEEATDNEITVSYRDNADIDLNSIDETDIVVSPVGSDEIRLTASISGFTADGDVALAGNQPQVTYRIATPGGIWQKEDNGVYRILLERDAVTDTRSGTPNRTVAQELGTFDVDIEFVGEINLTTTADGADSDTGDGVSSTAGGESTLRSAIQTANATAGLNTIVLSAQTYELTIGGDGEDLAVTGDLDITDDLVILGNGATILVNVPDGQTSDRVLDIFGAASVTLRGVTIEGGDVAGDGGGLRINDGTVEITGSLFTANTATTGGAIAQTGGTLNLTNSTISTNTASNAAGIDVSGGTANILHATITNNTATASTGGLRQSSTGVVNLTNTIVAANFATSSDPDTTGAFASPSHNLIGDVGTATGLTHEDTGNIVGDSLTSVDPLLEELADNTGPTKTHRLLPGSAAIDTADNRSAPATDQRSIARSQNGNSDEDAFSVADIGAVERFFGEINGLTYRDANGNGRQDSGEPGVAGFTVYLDLNNNEVLDLGEPQTISLGDDPATESIDETGTYVFPQVNPGEYVVREQVPTGWSPTSPVLDTDAGLVQLSDLLDSPGSVPGLGTVIRGNSDSKRVGRLVGKVGDVDGDGIDDFVIGSATLGTYIVYGVSGDFPAEILMENLASTFRVTSIVGTRNEVNDNMAVLPLGDIDRDGFDDFYIGGHFVGTSLSSNSNWATVVYGSASLGGSITVGQDVQPSQRSFVLSMFAGTAVAGDFNGDSFIDIAFGRELTAPKTSLSKAGRITVLFGNGTPREGISQQSSGTPQRYSGIPDSQLLSIEGASGGGLLGASLAVGDVNGDGIDDLIAGAPDAIRSGGGDGQVFVFFGNPSLATGSISNAGLGANAIDTADLSDIDALVLQLDTSTSGFGTGLAVTDVNNDGFSDVIAGNPNSSSNSLWVFSGRSSFSGSDTILLNDNTPASGTTVISSDFVRAGDSGETVDGLGDFNGDGFPDFLVSRPLAPSSTASFSGTSTLFFGNTVLPADFESIGTSSVAPSRAIAFQGFGLFFRFGRPLSGAGDVNGDGYSDLLIASDRADTHGTDNGNAFLLYGRQNAVVSAGSGSYSVNVYAGTVAVTQFGNQPLPVALSGTVYVDQNVDATRNAGEFGRSGVQVFIDQDSSGNLSDGDPVVITNAAGSFAFQDLAPFESYTLRIVVPDGNNQTAPDANDNFAITVTPESSDELTGLDFGISDSVGGEGAGNGSLLGRVFSDINGNRKQDSGEFGIVGATVFLDLNGNGVLDDSPVREPRTTTIADDAGTAVTNEAGDYSFSTLAERNYDVRVVLPDGLTQTFPFANEFAEAASNVEETPSDAVTVFFNDDELPDLVFITPGKNDVVVRLNNGDGTFAPAASILEASTRATLITPSDIDTGDLNGDDKPDFVIGNSNGNRPTVLLSTAGGGFVLGSVPSLGNLDTSSVAIGHFDPVNLAANPPITDLNRFPDIAIASEFDDKVYILRNNGSGSFTLAQTISTADAPLDLVAGDLDKDGDDDLVISQFGDKSIRTLLLAETGVFQTANPGNVFTKPTASNPFRLSAADFDADGFLDVVVTNVLDQRITVFRNQQTGVFEDGVNLLAGQNPASIITTDVNGDDAIDIVVTTLSNRGFATLLNLGDGTFQTPAASGVANLESQSAPTLVSSDIDLDGDPDIIVLQPERDGGTMFVEKNSTIAGSYRVGLTDGQTINALNFGIVDPALLNKVPTLDSIDDLSIDEDSGTRTVNVSGITAGGSESQTLRVTAVSGNPGLVPNPVVSYSSADETGSLQFSTASDAFGTATLTVTVEDAGPDDDFDLNDDNESFSRSFVVTIDASNDAPTINSISNIAIQEDAGEQTVALAGVTAGGGESQPLQITASSNNTSVIPTPTVTYLSPSSGGTLNFTSVGDSTGLATITVTVTDGGLDGDLSTSGDNGSTTKQFTVNVTEVNDVPTIDPIGDPPAIDEDSAQQTINVTGISTGGESETLQVTVASNNNGLILPDIAFDSNAGTAAIRYTPAPNRSGSTVLTVTVRDPGLDGQFEPGVPNADDGVTTEAFTVVVLAVNDPINGVDDSFTVVREDGAATFDVLANDIASNPDVGENLRVLIVTQPTLGSVQVVNAGSEVRYTPPATTVGQDSFTYVVTDGEFTDEATVTVTVNSNQSPAGAVLVSDFTHSRTGFDVSFSEALERSTLNLYATQSLGSADLVLTGSSVGIVRGSVAVNSSLRTLSFIATGGLLAPDSYTVTIRSGADGVVGSGGKLLDGNNDGTVGDDFVRTFTITAPVAEAVVVSLPDFARGFGQVVDVPADGTGLPLTLSRGAGVTGLNLRLTYDRDLLSVTSFVPTISGVFSDFNAGSGILALSSSTPFTSEAGPLTVGYWVASVPSTAIYASKHLVGIEGLVVFDDSVVPEEVVSIADEAIHVAAFSGDANGNRSYNSPDTTLTLRQITETIDGLTAYPLLDPRLISDVTFNQSIQANDATVVQRVITQIDIPTIPDLPSGIDPLPPVGVDPILSIPQNLTARLGQTITVPVQLEVTESSGITVSGLDVAIAYDASQFAVSNVRVGTLLTDNDLSPFVASANTVTPGQLLVTASSAAGTSLLAQDTTGAVFLIDFTVLPTAVGGASTINLLANSGGLITGIADNDLSDLVLSPAPTNTANDSVDGLLTVNDSPTLDQLNGPVVLNEDAGQQQITLTGISPGAENDQTVRVEVSSDNITLFPAQNLNVTLNGDRSGGTLSFAPAADQHGAAELTVTVFDNGIDKIAGTADDGSLSQVLSVNVTPVNDDPELTVPKTLSLDEDAGQRTVNLGGILAGNGENQPLSLTASSSNPNLVPNPTVTYTSPESTGSLVLSPVPQQSGMATITLRLEDGGLDQNLNTKDDNAVRNFTFTVNVAGINDAPTVLRPDDITLLEDAERQRITVRGITAGGGEDQPLKVTAASSNTALIETVSVDYTSPNVTGTLSFTPESESSGVSTITVTVEDGGLDGNLSTTGDNETATTQFTVTVSAVNDLPTIGAIDNPAAIDENASEQTVNVTEITTGGEEETLQVTVTSDNTDLIDPELIDFDAGAGTATVRYTPTADLFGSALLTVTVRDPGPNGEFNVGAPDSDDGVVTETFNVVVQPVDDDPNAPTQIVSAERSELFALPGGTVSFDLKYDASDADSSLSGLSFRLHFDSSKLSWVSATNLLDNGFDIASAGSPQADSSDFDGDAATDSFVLFNFVDNDLQFPGQELPAALAKVTFNSPLKKAAN